MAEASREAGADIRLNTSVTRIVVRDGRAEGVVLTDGTGLRASAVISSADPRRKLLGLVDPGELDPGFLAKVRNYRSRGATAKINLALRALPRFAGVTDRAILCGRIQVGHSIDYMERAFDAAKYGAISDEPYLDITIPTIQDPSLAPAGAHVMSIYVQFAPYALAGAADWESHRPVLADHVMHTLERYAPGITRLVEHQQIITPVDLEDTYGLTGGHIFHGEPSLDQLFTSPILGWRRTAHRWPVSSSADPEHIPAAVSRAAPARTRRARSHVTSRRCTRWNSRCGLSQ